MFAKQAGKVFFVKLAFAQSVSTGFAQRRKPASAFTATKVCIVTSPSACRRAIMVTQQPQMFALASRGGKAEFVISQSATLTVAPKATVSALTTANAILAGSQAV